MKRYSTATRPASQLGESAARLLRALTDCKAGRSLQALWQQQQLVAGLAAVPGQSRKGSSFCAPRRRGGGPPEQELTACSAGGGRQALPQGQVFGPI